MKENKKRKIIYLLSPSLLVFLQAQNFVFNNNVYTKQKPFSPNNRFWFIFQELKIEMKEEEEEEEKVPGKEQ